MKNAIDGNDWVCVTPSFVSERNVRRPVMVLARSVVRAARLASEDPGALEAVGGDVARICKDVPIKWRSGFETYALVLIDLVRHGWQVRLRAGEIQAQRPIRKQNASSEKERVRAQLIMERDSQLRQAATRRFVRKMEARRPYRGEFVSIFSLMRNGEELAEALRKCTRGRSSVVDAIVPYLQLAEPGKICPQTGLDLGQIWRYFRHTWSTAYRSVPGRSMMILVRDAAVESHPIIGIAALSSPTVQSSVRDDWIGWSRKAALSRFTNSPNRRLGEWLLETVNGAIAEIFVRDLVDDRVITRRELRWPNSEVIEVLKKEARRARLRHRRFADSKELKKSPSRNGGPAIDWEHRARMDLFRAKRCTALTELLQVRLTLRRFLRKNFTRKDVTALLGDSRGKRAVEFVVKKAKADRVGVAVSEVSVCGAIPPYNEVLGGKLVAMLLTSPELIQMYEHRYRGTPSVIASSMAGRPICRSSNLVLLMTSSLYSPASSQYNRIKIPSDIANCNRRDVVSYERLGETRGFGTNQFSEATSRFLARFSSHRLGGQRVNSVFGEGVNPRVRKIREGLDAMGLPSNALLAHGSPRIVYGVPLAGNFREYLLGFAKRPNYLLGKSGVAEKTRSIVEWWTARWLVKRIENVAILERVARHTLVNPIRHGARIPHIESENQHELVYWPDEGT